MYHATADLAGGFAPYTLAVSFPPPIPVTIPTDALARHSLLGIALVLGSAAAASTIGPLIRMMEDATGWQIIFYRSLAMLVALAAYLVMRAGRHAGVRLVRMGWRSVVGGICMGAATSMGTWAFLNTKVANVLFITGAAPFVTGLVAWALLGERVRRGTWGAIAIGFVGIAIMAGDGLAHGQILGDALALGSTVAYAFLVVAMRAERAAEDMIPMLMVGAAVATGIGAFLASDLAVSLRDLGLAIALGAGTSFLAYVLITLGARHVRAGELTLLASVEMVLGPTWVWLLIDEVPASAVLMGGTFVIAAIVVQGVLTARARRA